MVRGRAHGGWGREILSAGHGAEGEEWGSVEFGGEVGMDVSGKVRVGCEDGESFGRGGGREGCIYLGKGEDRTEKGGREYIHTYGRKEQNRAFHGWAQGIGKSFCSVLFHFLGHEGYICMSMGILRR